MTVSAPNSPALKTENSEICENHVQNQLEQTLAEFNQLGENSSASLDPVRKQRYEQLKKLLGKAMIYTDFVANCLDEDQSKIQQASTEAAASSVAQPAPEKQSEKQKRKEASKRNSGKFATSELPAGCHPKQPKLVTGAVMRDYQIQGMSWLVSLYENGLNGILADEMGLGKTLQCISLIAYLFERGVTGPFLIVAPLSTVPNWAKELKRFTPDIPSIVYHGSIEEREEIRRKHFKKDGRSWPVIVTSFEIAMRDANYFNKPIEFMMVDEGHRIKNLNCKLVRTLKSMQTSNRLLLTGTPLQNNLSELWSLLNFLLPDVFDDLDAFESWFDLGSVGSSEGSNPLLQAEISKEIIDSLHKLLKPFVLRRLKADVNLGLPPKREYIVYSSLTEKQMEMYKALLEMKENRKRKQDDLSHLIVEGPRKRKSGISYEEPDTDTDFEPDENANENTVQSDQESENMKNKRVYSGGLPENKSLQNLMIQLRKCCNHPYLFDFPHDEEGNMVYSDDVVLFSGKMRLLDRLLTGLFERGHRVLIFSQMTKMLNIIHDFMEYKGWKCCRIDGSVNHTLRQDEIESFSESEDTKAFLLSTRAGGLGINLTAADTVILFDSDWNPQMDLQAMDRCHRIGQTKPVAVYRFITRESVEVKMLEAAAEKRTLEKMVIHKKKFKKVSKNDQTIGAEELLEIINAERYRVNSAKADDNKSKVTEIPEEELERLMDRSDETFAKETDEGLFYKMVAS